MDQRMWVDETLDRLHECDDRADEDGEHDDEAGPALATHGAEEEGEPQRDRGRGIAEVVDQIGKQRDTQRARVDQRPLPVSSVATRNTQFSSF
jgi:hypothetical protein